MAYSEADLAAVQAAIVALATGARVTSATINGNSTSYHATDLPALRALRSEIAADVAAAAEEPSVGHVVISASKGL